MHVKIFKLAVRKMEIMIILNLNYYFCEPV